MINAVSVANGVVTFKNGGTDLEISTQGEIAAAVQYLQLQDLGAAGATVGFYVAADTFIFTQGSDDGVNNDLDIIVRLEDVQIDSLVTALGNGAGDLFLL